MSVFGQLSEPLHRSDPSLDTISGSRQTETLSRFLNCVAFFISIYFKSFRTFFVDSELTKGIH